MKQIRKLFSLLEFKFKNMIPFYTEAFFRMYVCMYICTIG